METERKKGKTAAKKIKSLRAKSLRPKQAKSVKGGHEGSAIATYRFENAWPTKVS